MVSLALRERLICRLAIDALAGEFGHERPSSAWTGTIARLDPGAGERLIVEHAELGQSVNRGRDQILAIADPGQSAPDLTHRALPRLEEPERRVEHHCGLVDSAEALAFLRKPFPPSTISHPLLGLRNALNRDRYRVHERADLGLDLGGDRPVGL